MLTECGHLFVGSTFDDLYYQVLYNLNRLPQHICSPRGSKVKENIACTLVLGDPRARLLSCKSREANYGFSTGEFLWYWQGKQDLDSMLYYNKRMKDFSNDGVTLNSAYGWRLKKKHEVDVFRPFGQWTTAIRTLVKDPDSRRAVLLINSPEDQMFADEESSNDVPCTLSLQFFIRENKLDLHVHMRSNDVIWGLTSDLFSFTLLQECMLLELKEWGKFSELELGKYFHTAGSMHVYERHFAQSEDIIKEYRQTSFHGCDVMEPLTSLEMLQNLCIEEDLLRRSVIDKIDVEKFNGLEKWMANRLNDHRCKRDNERSKDGK